MVVGKPAAEAQVSGGEIASEFLVADLVAGPGVRPDAPADLVLDLDVHPRRFPPGRTDNAPDAAGIVPGPTGLRRLLEPGRRTLLEDRDPVAPQVMPHGGEKRAARAGTRIDHGAGQQDNVKLAVQSQRLDGRTYRRQIRAAGEHVRGIVDPGHGVPERRQRAQDPARAAAELKDRRAGRHGRVHDARLAEGRQQRVELNRAPVAGDRSGTSARMLIHGKRTQRGPLPIPL